LAAGHGGAGGGQHGRDQHAAGNGGHKGPAKMGMGSSQRRPFIRLAPQDISITPGFGKRFQGVVNVTGCLPEPRIETWRPVAACHWSRRRPARQAGRPRLAPPDVHSSN
jgi:hypothetical protein